MIEKRERNKMKNVKKATVGKARKTSLKIDRAQERKPERPVRVSLYKKGVQHGDLPLRKGYKARWFSSKPGRIEHAKRAYWDFIRDAKGNPLTWPSGLYTLYAMETPEKYWLEDQKIKSDLNSRTIKNQQHLQSDEYIPEGRTHTLEKDIDPLA